MADAGGLVQARRTRRRRAIGGPTRPSHRARRLALVDRKPDADPALPAIRRGFADKTSSGHSPRRWRSASDPRPRTGRRIRNAGQSSLPRHGRCLARNQTGNRRRADTHWTGLLDAAKGATRDQDPEHRLRQSLVRSPRLSLPGTAGNP
jgi:hypothetical protein